MEYCADIKYMTVPDSCNQIGFTEETGKYDRDVVKFRRLV
jgi:hypothetical protein